MNSEDIPLSFLHANGLWTPGESIRWIPLAGGISSDIYRVEMPGRTICVKRALGKLKVEAHWAASISRSYFEWRWLQYASALNPRIAPRPLAHDSNQGILAMEYLAAGLYRNWKKCLLDGIVDVSVGMQVATALAGLHGGSMHRPDLLDTFDTQDCRRNFIDLRIEPYFIHTARRHPDIAKKIYELADQQAFSSIALIHGDISPKNILIGPSGPVFLDAECAVHADPIFDVTFCMNHFLLKSLVKPCSAVILLQLFLSFAKAYIGACQFVRREELERRVCELLPALLLARVDGKSPVEYLRDVTWAQAFVREFSRALLVKPCHSPGLIAGAWMEGLFREGRVSYDDVEVFRHQ